MSFPQTMSISCIFVFAPSFIRMDLSIVTTSTSLTFPEFLVLFSSISLLFSFIKVILHFHLPGGTSDIILSGLHVSSMFSTSSSFLELHLTSFHQASLGFLLRTSSDWSKGFSSCYHSKMGKHIAKSSSLTIG